MHNHVRHSRRERLPGVDRQHAAAARFQALQVRLGWPAALQQDSDYKCVPKSMLPR
jgi:hypothetical protein